ncbi:MAG: gliding motility-associated C-terminal domain-containing protein [Bacteroidota bacterium]
MTSTSPDATYSWLPVAGLSCSDCPTPTTVLSDTIQYIVVVDAEGCVTNTSFMVNAVERPELALPSDTTLCAGEPINLNSANADPNATYTWTSNNPNFTDINNPSPTISPDSTYTYSVVLEKDFCTTLEDEVTIGAVINELTVSPDVDACPFDTVQLSVVSTYEDATYSWEPITNLSCTDCPNPMTFSSDTIQYTINVDADGCLAFAFVTLNTVRMPEVTLPDTSVCLGEPVPLNSINDPVATYSWTSTDPDFTDVNNPTPTATPLVDATYNLVVEKNNCTEEHEGSVEVIEPATLEVDGTMNVCLDDQVELIATAIPASSQDRFDWAPDGAMDAVNAFTADQLGTFRYFVTFSNTCDVITDSIDFVVRDVALVTDDSLQFPEELIGANGCYSEGERFTISVNGLNPQDEVSWVQNGVAIGVGPAIEVQVIQEMEIFQAIVTTQFGCSTTIEKEICVNEAMIDMPNAFTPDSDGFNDYFAPVTLGLYEMPTTFRIWNRFGQLVYDNGNPQGWDGTHKGRLAPSDVYIYHIIVRDFTGEVFEDSGEVTLIR